MRRYLFGVVVALGIFASPAFAQDRGCQQRSELVACLDSPSVANERIAPDHVFGGWTLNRKTGRHAASVQLWLMDEANMTMALVPATVYWGPRPDAQTYGRLTGANVPELALGYSVVPSAPLPVGAWRVSVYITDLQRDPDAINWVVLLERRVIVQ